MPTIIINKDPNLELMLSNNEFQINFDSNALTSFLMIHLILFLFLYSVIKTMVLSPGDISLELSNEIGFEAIKNFKVFKEKPKNLNIFRHDLITKNLFEESGVLESENKENESDDEANSPTLFNFEQMIENKIFFDANKNVIDSLSQLSINEDDFFNFLKDNYKFCFQCRKFRPPRSYHCKECNRCILKMDHHCEWLHTCIGLQNYKYFFNTIFYGSCLFLAMLITYFNYAREAIFNQSIKIFYSYFIILVFLIMMVIFIRLIGLLILHMTLILTGRTAREFFKNEKGAQLRRYDMGYCENLKITFGENKLYWFLPI